MTSHYNHDCQQHHGVDWVAPRGQKTAPYGAKTGTHFTVAPPELTIEIAIDTIATAQLTSAQLFAHPSSW